MANPVYPVTLPKIAFVDNFQESPEDAVVEFPVEAGQPKRRRRVSGTMRIIDANLVLTTAQRAIILEFYEDDCGNGSLYFDMVHPIDGGSAVAWGWREPIQTQLISGNTWTASIKIRKIAS